MNEVTPSGQTGSRNPWKPALLLLLVLWGCHALNSIVLGGQLRQLGLQPRQSPLWHVLSAPFVHASWDHLLANSVSLLVLGTLINLRGVRQFWLISIIAGLISGLGIWLVAPTYSYGRVAAVHMGFSGVIFGYLGALLFIGWFERSASSMLLSIVTVIGFGSMVAGVLPGQAGVSWQGHLFGFLGGIVAARLTALRRT